METTIAAVKHPTKPDQMMAGGSRNPSVSIVIPAFNEEAVIKSNLKRICDYMRELESECNWELILVNDGSRDRTGTIAEEFASRHRNVHVLHHFVNFHIGQAFRFAFSHCRGDYVITMDLDLSYSPDHIGQLFRAIRDTRAKIVVASPYMEGGQVSNVPWMRRLFSRYANRFLSFTAKGRLSTLTGMVRAYDRRFLQSLDLKAMDYEINPEIIYKAQLLRARIVEIPAHLDWNLQRQAGLARQSSMKILRNVFSCLFSGFIFRPFLFFIIPGAVLMLLSLYTLALGLMHTWEAYQILPKTTGAFDTFTSAALATAFQKAPHTFFIGGISLIIAIQLISLGTLATQSKRYFEEVFHLGTSIYKRTILQEGPSLSSAAVGYGTSGVADQWPQKDFHQKEQEQ